MLTVLWSLVASAAECGSGGCPVPPHVDGAALERPSGKVPPLDQVAHGEIRVATFALG
ncbi:MAG: hypothetical protein H6735_10970 [Alphaproteobacteria bacterium]|nr:hypothetical protein [Alphaproteobacteria bacterium]